MDDIDYRQKKILEIQNARLALERELLTHIHTFEAEFGVHVREISFRRPPWPNVHGRSPLVDVSVILKESL